MASVIKKPFGIIYFGYRFYLPNEGRWLNRDPIEEMGGLNLYQYVKNNPVGFVDPLGLKGLAGFGGRGADAAKATADAIDQGCHYTSKSFRQLLWRLVFAKALVVVGIAGTMRQSSDSLEALKVNGCRNRIMNPLLKESKRFLST